MKSNFIKMFMFSTTVYFLIVIYKSYAAVKTSISTYANTFAEQSTTNTKSRTNNANKPMKYILQWTSDTNVPFVHMGKGQSGFVKRNCPYVNCFVSSSKRFLGDYTKFDAIVFAGPDLFEPANDLILPKKRSAHQKYVFASVESAGNYRACSKMYNGFFNWTWTYKLDSEIRWGYIAIRDKDHRIIGPKKDMNWLKLEDMELVSDEFKMKLKSKKKAAAWFVSNCYTNSGREKFTRELRMELLYKYQLTLDVFGTCTVLQCSQDKEKECDKKIADHYYFYLAFENSFSEDYVTEKLLRALNNDAVPIVYGGANYTRFMPDGAYLNARELGVAKLAEKMHELISDPDKYAEYFRWRNHYSYHSTAESVETNEYCKMCELLNDDQAMNNATAYDDFQRWWDGPSGC